jgi:hypothetical protein
LIVLGVLMVFSVIVLVVLTAMERARAPYRHTEDDEDLDDVFDEREEYKPRANAYRAGPDRKKSAIPSACLPWGRRAGGRCEQRRAADLAATRTAAPAAGREERGCPARIRAPNAQPQSGARADETAERHPHGTHALSGRRSGDLPPVQRGESAQNPAPSPAQSHAPNPPPIKSAAAPLVAPQKPAAAPPRTSTSRGCSTTASSERAAH